MIGKNEIIPVNVLTQKGVKAIQDVDIGDIVFEYKTSRPLKVYDIKRYRVQPVYEVTYTDRRKEFYSIQDYIYTGYSIIPLIRLLRYPNETKLGVIKMHQTDFELPDMIRDELTLDPYIVGALLMHGDIDDEYVNLPMDRDAADNFFSHKYSLNFGNRIGSNKVYYKYNGDTPESLITWKEFFKGMNCYVVTKDARSPFIPDEYKYGTLNDRWQFVRGAFDIGYHEKVFPDHIGINSFSEYRLKELQSILWSLGVESLIRYDPDMISAKGRKYRLDVVGTNDGYPGLFYDIYAMENTIYNDNTIPKRIHKKYRLMIEDIKPYTDGVIYNLELVGGKKLMYLTDQYLPRVSL